MKSSEKKIFRRGKKPSVSELKNAFDLVKLRHDTPEFSELCKNYGYDLKTNQMCSICSNVFDISVSQIMRKIYSSVHAEQTICIHCSPSNLNESTIISAIENALNTKFIRNTRPIKIFRDDHPVFFESIKRNWTQLELDAIEISSESNKHRKKLILEIDGITHFRNKNGLNRDSNRTRLADAIKNELVPKMYPDHIFIRIALSENSYISENLVYAHDALNAAGIYISNANWHDSIAKMTSVNTPYRKKIISNINVSGAKFRDAVPAVIQQNTILQLFCKNDSIWPATASIFAAGAAGCPCFECANRRALLPSEIDDVGKRAGVNILTEKSQFLSDDLVECSCIKCSSILNNLILIRKIREKSRGAEKFSCRYCNIKAAIPAIRAYMEYQDNEKMTEKAAHAKVMAKYNVNPSSLWQSFRNDYRDGKLSTSCKTLLEESFLGKLKKKKQGNKFTDEQLVTYLEKLYSQKYLSEDEKLQSEENTRKRFRKKATDGNLPPELRARLLAINVNLEPYTVFTTEERLAQLKEFVAQNGRLPREKEFKDKRDAGDEDAGLYAWQRDQFFKLKHNKLADLELAAELITIIKIIRLD